MDQKKLKAFQEKLVQKKQEILEAYQEQAPREGGRRDGAQDIADKASSSYTKEFLFSLSNTEREPARSSWTQALARLETAASASCVACEDEMNPKRLEAVPWAEHCLRCQEKQEQGCCEPPRRPWPRWPARSAARRHGTHLLDPAAGGGVPVALPRLRGARRPPDPRPAVRALLGGLPRHRHPLCRCGFPLAPGSSGLRALPARPPALRGGGEPRALRGRAADPVHELKYHGRRRVAARLAEELLRPRGARALLEAGRGPGARAPAPAAAAGAGVQPDRAPGPRVLAPDRLDAGPAGPGAAQGHRPPGGLSARRRAAATWPGPSRCGSARGWRGGWWCWWTTCGPRARRRSPVRVS